MDLIAFVGILTGVALALGFWLSRRKTDDQDASFKRYVKTLDDKQE